MAEREKVIKGLEIHTMYASCKDCPYWDGVGSKCSDLLRDALKVLKEQKTVRNSISKNQMESWLKERQQTEWTNRAHEMGE